MILKLFKFTSKGIRVDLLPHPENYICGDLADRSVIGHSSATSFFLSLSSSLLFRPLSLSQSLYLSHSLFPSSSPSILCLSFRQFSPNVSHYFNYPHRKYKHSMISDNFIHHLQERLWRVNLMAWEYIPHTYFHKISFYRLDGKLRFLRESGRRKKNRTLTFLVSFGAETCSSPYNQSPFYNTLWGKLLAGVC